MSGCSSNHKQFPPLTRRPNNQSPPTHTGMPSLITYTAAELAEVIGWIARRSAGINGGSWRNEGVAR